MPPSFWYMFPLCLFGSAWLLWWLAARVTPDPRLRRIVLISYGLRVGLGIALYAISYWHLPILSALQTSEPGFWEFGPDASLYHQVGMQMVDSWNKGIELPRPERAIEYFVMVGAIYKLLGAHPLYPILLNGWLAAVTGLLAYVVGRRIGGARTALVSGLLVSCWPSSFIWSAQLLKESLTWCLSFCALALVFSLLPRPAESTATPPWRLWRLGARASAAVRTLGLCLLLGLAVLSVARLRFYMGSALAIAAFVVFVPAAVWAAMRRSLAHVRAYGLILLAVMVAAFWSQNFNVFALVSPSHPERGHYRLAQRYRDEGKLAQAEEEFRRALMLSRARQEVYMELAALYLQQGKREEARRVYLEYLSRNEDEAQRQVRHLVAQLDLEVGGHAFNDGRIEEAGDAYYHAVLLDPKSAVAYVDLGLFLEHQGQPEVAMAKLRRGVELAKNYEQGHWIKTQLARVYANRAERLIDAGRFHDAALVYDEALEWEALSLPSRVRFGFCLSQTGEHDRAVAMFESALDLTRADAVEDRQQIIGYVVPLYHQRASERLAQGDRAGAIQQHERIVGLTPASGEAHVQLALLLAEDAVTVGRAVRLLKRALELLPVEAEARREEIRLLLSRFSSSRPAFRAAASEQVQASLPSVVVVAAPPKPLDAPAQGVAVPQPVSASQPDPGVMAAAKTLVALPEETEPPSPLQKLLERVFKKFRTPELSTLEELPRPIFHVSPQVLTDVRQGFVVSGGRSLMDTQAEISTVQGLVRYLPRALLIGLLAPFPNQWFDARGSTKGMRILSAIDLLLLYVLLLPMGIGMWRLLRTRRAEQLFFVAFPLLVWMAASLAVANIGTLFRLRLLFLLPLLVVAAHGEPFWDAVARWWLTRRAAPGPVRASAMEGNQAS